MKQPPMKLREWIPEDKVIEWALSCNPNAITYLEKHPHLISWGHLSMNPNAIELIEKKLARLEKSNSDPINLASEALLLPPNTSDASEPNGSFASIKWGNLSSNPGAIRLLENNRDKINLSELLYNPNADRLIESYMDKICRYEAYMDILLDHPTNFKLLENHLNKLNKIRKIKIDWYKLSKKATRMEFLEKHFHKISWTGLSQNPNAIPLLEKNLDKVDWDWLSTNPNAIHLLEKNLDKIDWGFLYYNPNAVRLFEENPDKINWRRLSCNPNAIHLLEKNLDHLDWCNLSMNPNAIHLIEQNPKKHGINWNWLSRQPYTMDLFKNNIDKIDWYYFTENPAIFTYDYEAMREANRELKEELIQRAWHPDRVAGWLEAGMDLEDL